MSIVLTDFPAAVTAYLDTEVTMTVTDVTPKSPFDGTLNVNDRGRTTVTAENAADGLRLLNVRFHLEIVARKGGDPDPKTDPNADADAKKVAQLIAPADAGLVCDDNNGNTVAGGAASPSGELVIKFTDGRSALDAGAKLAETVEIQCTDHGDVKVTAHIHADVDQSALFPNGKGKNGSGALVVDF